MTKNENQHWVPKFLIRNFADTDGRVFRLDIQTDVITKPPPKHAAAAIAFNEFGIDGRSISFEAELTKIETRAAPILQSIVAAGSVTGCSSRDRRKLADFMAAQSFRTEAFYRGFDGSITRNAFGEIFAQAWRSAFIVADELYRRHWALMEAVGETFFYLGDSPLVLQRTENPSDGSGLGFDVSGVEAFLPLSPRFALYMPCRFVSDQIIEGFANAKAVSQGAPTTELGRELAQKILSEHSPLHVALTTGVALPCLTENIENLNYLQCSWAFSAVYSHERRFDFARKVFRETPQFRQAPKVSMIGIGRPLERR
jgi:hypothetical protein